MFCAVSSTPRMYFGAGSWIPLTTLPSSLWSCHKYVWLPARINGQLLSVQQPCIMNVETIPASFAILTKLFACHSSSDTFLGFFTEFWISFNRAPSYMALMFCDCVHRTPSSSAGPETGCSPPSGKPVCFCRKPHCRSCMSLRVEACGRLTRMGMGRSAFFSSTLSAFATSGARNGFRIFRMGTCNELTPLLIDTSDMFCSTPFPFPCVWPVLSCDAILMGIAPFATPALPLGCSVCDMLEDSIAALTCKPNWFGTITRFPLPGPPRRLLKPRPSKLLKVSNPAGSESSCREPSPCTCAAAGRPLAPFFAPPRTAFSRKSLAWRSEEPPDDCSSSVLLNGSVLASFFDVSAGSSSGLFASCGAFTKCWGVFAVSSNFANEDWFTGVFSGGCPLFVRFVPEPSSTHLLEISSASTPSPPSLCWYSAVVDLVGFSSRAATSTVRSSSCSSTSTGTAVRTATVAQFSTPPAFTTRADVFVVLEMSTLGWL
mmetsp:Transcript_15910/g.39386  ORF Transcript_15910/g.39386 Transcript_15910/m.39386 type:complete len:487 (-) Transcript_15910:395-1855(-)